ncbi:hypothetical protein BPUTSESOX_1400 [uncultured Gammaproteobacteria bacterium]|nr:hypothetical protein BPUTSESOX_1400 [uncultured Gammaproteobacteria bacterium]
MYLFRGIIKCFSLDLTKKEEILILMVLSYFGSILEQDW